MNRNTVVVSSSTGVGGHNLKWALRFFLCLLTVCLSVTARAQVGSASLSGVVEDPSSAVVRGATVTLQNTASGAQLSGKSNGSGAFSFAAVPSGDYTLKVSMSG